MTTPKHSLSREATQMPKYTILSYWFWGKGGKVEIFRLFCPRSKLPLNFSVFQ